MLGFWAQEQSVSSSGHYVPTCSSRSALKYKLVPSACLEAPDVAALLGKYASTATVCGIRQVNPRD